MRLEPCPQCERHVRVSEANCPFCGASVKESFASLAERNMPTSRLGRAALFAFGAAAVASAVACSDEPDVVDDDKDASVKDASVKDASVTDASRPVFEGGIAPIYGAPIFKPDASTLPEAGVIAPPYGVPIFPDAAVNDAGNTDASTRRDSGGFIPLYGLAVPPDDNTDNS